MLPLDRSVEALRLRLVEWRRAGEKIALVPTMGALHFGHLHLCEIAKQRADRVVVSLFVNPKQFDRPEDLARYPRNEQADAAMLLSVGVDVLFAPPVAEVYPPGFSTTVSITGLTDCLCGAARPGHFTGMATVVTKLLLMAMPNRAFFGEKDYQQLTVIRRLVRDLNIPVTIEGCATQREASGLAMSSRNQRLSAQERELAPLLYATLSGLAGDLADGKTLAAPLLARAKQQLLEGGFRSVDYLELRDADELQALDKADRPARVFAAAWLGDTRLIDNVPVG